jgi:iron complex transport system ATP-binding protein
VTPALVVESLRVTLGGAPILHGVDLTVTTGEWVTVIGPNGAGKSTVLRAVSGVVPFSGRINLLGTESGRMRRRDRARLVASVPQSPVVPPGMTVLDYVLLGRTPYIRPLGSESRTDLEVAHGVLARLDLAPFAARALETLSGGERQRAFLARALAQGATLLLLDEPTTSLDIGHQQEVLDLVDELRADHQLTVLATMHDLSIAGEYADRMVLLAGGRVAASGPPAEVLTEELLSEHYGARVRVVAGEHGPLIVPVRRSSPASGSDGARPGP